MKITTNELQGISSKEAEKVNPEMEDASKLSKEVEEHTYKEVGDNVVEKVNPKVANSSKLPEGEAKEDNSKEVEVAKEQVKEVLDIEAIKERTAIFFHSSVAKNLDLDRFEKATKTKINMVKTYHIEEKRKCADPELHLLNTVGESKADNLDLAIFAVGSNDVQRTEEDDTLNL